MFLPEIAEAVAEENATARLAGLRAALSGLAIIALIGLFFTRRIPTEQPAAVPDVVDVVEEPDRA